MLATGGPRLSLPCSIACSRVSLVALLATLVLLFGFQGEQIIAQPLVIALLAVPILIQVYFNAGLAYLLNRVTGEAHCVAGPSALIGASNFFELAVAAAISLFGFESGAALATVVGVLIEVPVMLSVVWIVNATRAGTSAKPRLSRSLRSPEEPRRLRLTDYMRYSGDKFSSVEPVRDQAERAPPTPMRRRAGDAEPAADQFPARAVGPRPDQFGALRFEIAAARTWSR